MTSVYPHDYSSPDTFLSTETTSPVDLWLEAATEESNRAHMDKALVRNDEQERIYCRSVQYLMNDSEIASEERFKRETEGKKPVRQDTVAETSGSIPPALYGTECVVEPSGYLAMKDWQWVNGTNDGESGDDNNQSYGANCVLTLPQEVSKNKAQDAESKEGTQSFKRRRISVDEDNRNTSGLICPISLPCTLTQEDSEFHGPIYTGVSPYLSSDDNYRFMNQASYETESSGQGNGQSDGVCRRKGVSGQLEWRHCASSGQTPEASVGNITWAATNNLHSLSECIPKEIAYDAPIHFPNTVSPACHDSFFASDGVFSTSPTNLSFLPSENVDEPNYEEVLDPRDQMYFWTTLNRGMWHQHYEQDALLNFHSWWGNPVHNSVSLEQSNADGSSRIPQTRQSTSITSTVSYTPSDTSTMQSPSTQVSFDDNWSIRSDMLANDRSPSDRSPTVSHESFGNSQTHRIEQYDLPGTLDTSMPNGESVGDLKEANGVLGETELLSPCPTLLMSATSPKKSQEESGLFTENFRLRCAKCGVYITAQKKRNARQNLSRHKNTIHSDRLLVCRNGDCSITFTRSDNRLSHERTVHKLELRRGFEEKDTVRKSSKRKRSLVQ